MKKKLDTTEAPEGVWPICPHYRQELRFIWIKSKGLGFLGRRQFPLYPHGRAFLGFGDIHWRGALYPGTS